MEVGKKYYTIGLDLNHNYIILVETISSNREAFLPLLII